MRVIHGVWAHGALCLWAEDPDLPPVSGVTPSDVHLPQPHPFACQAAELGDLLAGRPGSQEAVRKAVHNELILQLPTAGGGPLASPELVRPEAAGDPGAPATPASTRRSRVSLASWRVPVLAFGPAAALVVLRGPGQGDSGLAGSGSPDEAAISGGSLTYLAAVARFAAR